MRLPKIKTAWKMSVCFKSHAYSNESLKGRENTPEELLAHIEDFAARLRRDIANSACADAGTEPQPVVADSSADAAPR